uniref:Uncharacterized protein n=1 Tax=Meloidogyne incognita TaxID=6306 RepID=A0A914MZ37_MELIC
MDPKMRKELWPFLLRIFPWSSTYEHRESIRNDLFLRYQRMKRNRILKKFQRLKKQGKSFMLMLNQAS